MVKGDHARNAGWATLGMILIAIAIVVIDAIFN